MDSFFFGYYAFGKSREHLREFESRVTRTQISNPKTASATRDSLIYTFSFCNRDKKKGVVN